MPGGSEGRRFFQRWGVLLVVGVLLCGVWLFIASTLAVQKTELIEERQRQLAQLNTAVAQQTAALLRQVEMTLKTMDRHLQSHPRIDPLTDPVFVSLVDMLRRASNGLIELRVISSAGQLFHIPSLDGKPLADVRDRPYFKDQIAPPARKLFIGDPVMARSLGKWIVPVSWPLESSVAGFAVVSAALQLDRLSALHERMRLKPSGTITLLQTGGIVLSRTPYDEALVGKDLSSSPNFRAHYGVKWTGAFVTDNALTDGVPRISSFERLDDYPLIVMVGEGLREVLQPWYARRDLTIALTALVSLVILGLAIALQRFLWAMHGAQERLERRAAVDTLTGTLRRGAFLELAQREFGRVQRYGRSTVIAALDLDHFKKVNDTHGHAAGDTVLRECTSAWLTVLRDQDLLGRVGGEEFCAILPETDLEGARRVAERLREVTSRLRFGGEGASYTVTVSIGLTAISASDGDLVEALERADKALYAAKNAGRDRVEAIESRRPRVLVRRPSPVPPAG